MRKIICREEHEFSFIQIRRVPSKLCLSSLKILFGLFELFLGVISSALVKLDLSKVVFTLQHCTKNISPQMVITIPLRRCWSFYWKPCYQHFAYCHHAWTSNLHLAYPQAAVCFFPKAYHVSCWKLSPDFSSKIFAVCIIMLWMIIIMIQKLILPKTQPVFQCSRFPVATKKVRSLCNEFLQNHSP